jgi:hypothetical protein
MLGEFALDGIEYIESSESRALAEHRVPGLAGNYFQDMGAVANTIVIAGTKSGDEARDDFLNGIRTIFNKGEQTTFVTDINTATDITDVIIEDLEVAEIGGSVHSFRYQLKLRKYTKPPEPPQMSLLDTGILGDALNVLDALNALDALSSIPNFGDPTGPIRGALDNLKGTTGGLDQAVGSVRNLLSQDVPAPGAPGAGGAPGANGGPGADGAPGTGGGPGTGTTPGAASETGAAPAPQDGSTPTPEAGDTTPTATAPDQNGSGPGTAGAPGTAPGTGAPGTQAGPGTGAPGTQSGPGTGAPGTGGPGTGAPGTAPGTGGPAAAPAEVVSPAAAGPGLTSDEFDRLELTEAPPTQGETEPAKEGDKCTVGVEVGFVHFNIDRHTLMPEGPTPEPGTEPPGGGVDGLQVVAGALDHARKHPQRQMLVTGHSDSTAIISYNLPLSARRADSTFCVLQGFDLKDLWVQLALRDGGHADDWRRILRWVDKTFQLNCEASDPNKPDAAKDQKAIANFQKGYNKEVEDLKASGTNPFAPGFTQKIPGSQLGFVGLSTWQAFFDFYQRDLIRQLSLSTQTQLATIQKSVKLVKIPTQGCGEFHSRDLTERAARREAGYPEKPGPKEPRDRRIEILFFDPAEVPPFECHPTTDVNSCQPSKCELYKNQQFVPRSLPVLGATATQPTITLDRMEVRPHGNAEFEPGSSFNPRVRGRIKFIVSVAGLSTPFEGKVQLTLSRNTTDGMTAVAVVAEELCSTAATATVEVIWNGAVDRAVPRQVSNRTTPDLNPGNDPSKIPLREMDEDSLVLHGLYAVEKIELVEKDDSVAASVTPANGGFVVPMVCTLHFDPMGLAGALGRFGFADGTRIVTPYIEDIRRAIFLVATSYYRGIGVQFFFTHARENAAGIRVEITEKFVVFGQAEPGATKLQETVPDGINLLINIFGWSDETFFKRDNGDEFFVVIGPEALLDRNLDQNSDDSKMLNEVFGPLGVSRTATSTSRDDQFRPQATRPRTMTNGKVDGRVTFEDHNNTSVSLSSEGVFTVTTIDPTIVPPQRATEIQRALNAFTNATGLFVAHELGHALGLIAETNSQKAIIAVEDRGRFLSPLAGTQESHNAKPLNELMDNGNAFRLRTIFTPGSRVPLGATNRRYLTDCFPAAP